MIITRSPLRITLGGGGTDLPSYYREHGGFLMAAAIDRYVYITIHRTFEQELIAKYSRLERVRRVDELKHPIIREALLAAGIAEPHMEIASMADIPAGTGLGSSGAFTTALLKALHTFQNRSPTAAEIAEQACDIEIGKLHEPIGKQDQYMAAFGGATCLEFSRDGQVQVSPLALSEETLANLQDNLLLFFTGFTRSASEILKEQDVKTREADGAMVENLHFIKELGRQSHAALIAGDLQNFAHLMHTHWSRKKERSKGMSNGPIDGWYDFAMKNGALGGKLIGAGGGGFLMFYTEENARLRRAMRSQGLQEVPFRFDFEGTKILVQNR